MRLKAMSALALMDGARLNGVEPASGGGGRVGPRPTTAIASQCVIKIRWCRLHGRPMRGADHAIHGLHEVDAIAATSNGSWDRVSHHTQTALPLKTSVGV
jgi:hypothetical protein